MVSAKPTILIIFEENTLIFNFTFSIFNSLLAKINGYLYESGEVLAITEENRKQKLVDPMLECHASEVWNIDKNTPLAA